MKLAVVVAIVFGLLAGTGSARAQEYALVRDGTWLRTAPSDSALGARVADKIGDVRVVRIRAARRDWVEVETVATDRDRAEGDSRKVKPRHCHDGFDTLDAYALRLFVRRSELAQVTTRHVRVTFADDTALELAAGVAVTPVADPEGVYTVEIDSARFEASLPAKAIGTRYKLRKTPWSRSVSRRMVRDGAAFSVDGRTVGRRGASWMIDAELTRGDRALVTRSAACSSLRGLVDAKDVVDVGGMLSGSRDDGGGIGGQLRYVSAGKPVFWQTGKRAGQLRSRIDVGLDAKTVGGFECMPAPLTHHEGDDGRLTVCFRSKDVEVDEPQAAMINAKIDSSPSDRVAKVVKANARAIRECYRSELARDPKLGGGKVVVKFVIAPDGKVTSSAVESTTLSSRPVKDCIIAQVRRWKFPAVDGETKPTTVRFPFNFSKQ